MQIFCSQKPLKWPNILFVSNATYCRVKKGGKNIRMHPVIQVGKQFEASIPAALLLSVPPFDLGSGIHIK